MTDEKTDDRPFGGWWGSKSCEPLLVDLDSLELNPDNVRKHSDRQVRAIMASLTEFGQVTPIAVKHVGEATIVHKGNGTVTAMRELGWKQVAVVDVDHLDGLNLTAYGIADNRTAELASWDPEGLLIQLEEIQKQSELDIEKHLAFNEKELSRIQKEANAAGGGGGGGGSEPEVPFTEELLEAHNYVVLKFDNEVDWLNARSLLDLQTVQALDSKEGFRKAGIGRVLDGPTVLRKLTGQELPSEAPAES